MQLTLVANWQVRLAHDDSFHHLVRGGNPWVNGGMVSPRFYGVTGRAKEFGWWDGGLTRGEAT